MKNLSEEPQVFLSARQPKLSFPISKLPEAQLQDLRLEPFYVLRTTSATQQLGSPRLLGRDARPAWPKLSSASLIARCPTGSKTPAASPTAGQSHFLIWTFCRPPRSRRALYGPG